MFPKERAFAAPRQNPEIGHCLLLGEMPWEKAEAIEQTENVVRLPELLGIRVTQPLELKAKPKRQEVPSVLLQLEG